MPNDYLGFCCVLLTLPKQSLLDPLLSSLGDAVTLRERFCHVQGVAGLQKCLGGWKVSK